jgi:hypothetical protein
MTPMTGISEGHCMRRWLGLLITLAIAGCGATAAVTPAAAQGDAPPLIAGRVAAVEGDVSIWRTEEAGANGQWDRAQVNDVVTAGTGLATDNGRIEVRVGPHAFRLGAGSSGAFGQLDFGKQAFALERGVLNARIAAGQQGEAVTVDVAGVRIGLSAPGRYRIDAVGDSPLNVTVFEGQAAVRYGSSGVTVNAGQALVMTQSSMSFAGAMTTALDDWAFARDARYQQVQATRYVSPDMTGVEELDAYGDWVGDPTYGTLWVPRAVPVGWAPYRDGRWRWVSPWGWTWVDAAPWGYAPFHYGRWVVLGGRWCWWPGGYVARPVWAPALVGFVGGGTTVSVGFGGPVVGWYPLAPWHAYRPYYRTSPTYVTVINQTIIQRPPRGVPHDVNQRPGSTWVPGPRFREPVAKVRLPAKTEAIAEMPQAAPPPRPTRTAAIYDDARVNAPGGRVGTPPMRAAPGVAQNTPKFSVTPPQPLPGADTTLSQPAPIRRVEPRPLPPAPGQLPDREAPRAKVPVPQEIVPPYQQLQKPFPAEPARTPPAAPPTIRQPVVASTPRAAPPASAQNPPAPPAHANARAPGAAPAPRAPIAVAPATPATSMPPPRAPAGVGPPRAPVTAAPGAAATQPAAPARPVPPGKAEAAQTPGEPRAPKPDVPRPKTVLP